MTPEEIKEMLGFKTPDAYLCGVPVYRRDCVPVGEIWFINSKKIKKLTNLKVDDE